MRITGADECKFRVSQKAGPVPGPHRLILHLVSAIYPPESSGRYTMDMAMVFERRLTVVADQMLSWRLKTSEGIAL